MQATFLSPIPGGNATVLKPVMPEATVAVPSEKSIQRRCYLLSIQVLKFSSYMAGSSVYPVVIEQLVRSSAGQGAMVADAAEALNAQQRASCLRAALQYNRELKYYLCLVRDTFDVERERVHALLDESLRLGDLLASYIEDIPISG